MNKLIENQANKNINKNMSFKTNILEMFSNQIRRIFIYIFILHCFTVLLVPGATSGSGKNASTSSSSSAAAAAATNTTKVPKVKVSFKYHNYEAMTNLLASVEKKYPNYVRRYSIGKSVEGRELWVLHLTE